MKKLILTISYLLIVIFTLAQNNCENLLEQAQKNFANKNYGQALSILNQAQKCNVNDSIKIKIYDFISRIYMDLDKYNQAIRYAIQKEHLLQQLNTNNAILDELFRTEIFLSEAHQKLNEYNIGIDYLSKALDIAFKLNDKRKIAIVYEKIGDCNTNLNFYDKALNNYFASYKYYKLYNYTKQELEILLKIAQVYTYKGEYKNALETYYQALDISKNLNNQKQGQIYLAIANLLFNLKLYDQAQKYLKQTESIINNSDLLAQVNILKAKILITQKQLDKAEELLLYTIKKIDKKENLLISDIYDLLGIIKLIEQNLKECYRYLLMSYNIRKKSNDLLRLGESYAHLGLYFIHNKNIHLGQIYLTKAYKTFSLVKNYQELGKISLYLSRLYRYTENYEEAYKYLDIYRKIEDSIIHTNQVDILQKLEERSKIHLDKELAIQRLNLSKKYNKYLIISLIILLTLVFFLAFQTIKVVKKNKILKTQKQKLEEISLLLQQQNISFKRLYLATYLSNNCIFITKPDGTIVWFNKTCQQIYNLNKKTIGKNLKKLSTYKKINEVYEVVNKKKNVKYTNFHIVNGKKIWLQTLLTPLIIDGKVVEIIGVESNITPHIINTLKIHHQQKLLSQQNKLLEAYNLQLKEQQRELQEKNEELLQQQEELKRYAEILEETIKQLEQFSIVLKYIDNLVYLIDINKKVIWWNKSFAKKIKINSEINNNNKIKVNNWLAENFDNSKIFSEYFNKTINTKKSFSFIYQQKFIQEKLWMQTTMTPIFNKDKTQVEYIAVIQSDISKLKKTEEELSEKNRELISSMEYAKKIQKALSPMPIFMEALFYKNYFIFMRPKDIVSGDFYWARMYKGKILLVIADATGHGIPAAFISLIGSMAMNAVIDKLKELSASAFLSELKERISLILHQRGKKDEAKDSIDLAFCIFDFNTKTLEYAGAYIPLYILRKNKDTNDIEIIILKENKNTIGFDMHKTTQFKSHKIKLEYEDMIYITTDGFVDQFGGEYNKKFKRRRFFSLLKSIYKLPVYDQRNKIKETFYKWKKNNPQVDDVLVFGLRIDENLI